MIIKLLSSAIIISCSTMIGMELAKRHILRTKELRELQGALSRLQSEISHYSTRLPEALEQIGGSIRGEVGSLLKNTAFLLQNKRQYTIQEAWQASLLTSKRKLNIHPDEYEILMRFGDQLGCSDKDGQLKYIHLTLTQLYDQELKAQALRSKYERMYKSLGLLGGLALAIILL